MNWEGKTLKLREPSNKYVQRFYVVSTYMDSQKGLVYRLRNLDAKDPEMSMISYPADEIHELYEPVD